MPLARVERKRKMLSVVKEKALRERHEEQCSDSARQRAKPAYRQKACDEQTNKAAEYCANFRQHCSHERRDPMLQTSQPRWLARPDQNLALPPGWLDQARLDGARPMPPMPSPASPGRDVLDLVWHQAGEQRTRLLARPNGCVSRASVCAPACFRWS